MQITTKKQAKMDLVYLGKIERFAKDNNVEYFFDAVDMLFDTAQQLIDEYYDTLASEARSYGRTILERPSATIKHVEWLLDNYVSSREEIFSGTVLVRPSSEMTEELPF